MKIIYTVEPCSHGVTDALVLFKGWFLSGFGERLDINCTSLPEPGGCDMDTPRPLYRCTGIMDQPC